MTEGAWYGGRRSALFALFGALAALVPAAFMWGFTVDDALISLRYAHHVAIGVGYRFDAGGPVTDGVTPLPWAPLVSCLSRGDLFEALVRVKVLGLVAWTAAAAALGITVFAEQRTRAAAALGLVTMGLAFPISTWAVSGMETGLATALATLAAVSFARPTRAAIFAGLAASLRPELVVWSVAIGTGAAIAAKARPSVASAVAAVAALPFAACTVVRLVVFGRAAPLAVLAKPSDLSHGLEYTGAAAVVLLLPILALAPLAVVRSSPRARVIALAALAHLAVVIAVGGDWMPYARLVVPIAPSLVLVWVDSWASAHRASIALRGVAALGLGVLLAVRAAPLGRHVQRDRLELVRRARPVLAEAKIVAGLDVGWLGAAAPDDASIVDLAGLTDPAIALLSGGHTSKRVDLSMLLDRGVDTLVLYGEPRAVELRLLRSPLFAERFGRVATLPLGDRGATYAVYRRKPRD